MYLLADGFISLRLRLRDYRTYSDFSKSHPSPFPTRHVSTILVCDGDSSERILEKSMADPLTRRNF